MSDGFVGHCRRVWDSVLGSRTDLMTTFARCETMAKRLGYPGYGDPFRGSLLGSPSELQYAASLAGEDPVSFDQFCQVIYALRCGTIAVAAAKVDPKTLCPFCGAIPSKAFGAGRAECETWPGICGVFATNAGARLADGTVKHRATKGCFNVTSTRVFSNRWYQKTHSPYENLRRDDHPSKNEPKRVETGRDMSLES